MNIFHVDGVLEIILLNSVAWLILHLAAAGACSLIPRERFAARSRLFRHAPWEKNGRIYQRLLRVKAWKSRLPDCGKFKKKRLSSRNPEYLRAYLAETCRAELTHIIVIAAVPLFIIWNNWLAAACMLPYALLENLPCIIAQRYNRGKLFRILGEGVGKI